GGTADGLGATLGRTGAYGSGRQLQRLGSAGPCHPSTHLPDRESDPFGAGYSGSLVVSAADGTRPRCDPAGRPDADRGRLGRAQAPRLVAHRAGELSQRTPTGPRRAPFRPRRVRATRRALASANDARPRWSRGFARPTASGGALPACAASELARLGFGGGGLARLGLELAGEWGIA